MSAIAGGDSTSRDTTSISGRTGGLCLPVRWRRSGRMPRGTMRRVSVSVMKAGWMRGPSQGYPDGVAGTFDAGVGENVIETVSRQPCVYYRDLSPDLNANGEIEPEEWIKQCPCFNVIEDKKLH